MQRPERARPAANLRVVIEAQNDFLAAAQDTAEPALRDDPVTLSKTHPV